MKVILPALVSSVLVSVLLLACSDDKGGASGTSAATNTTNNNSTTDGSGTTEGDSSTGGPDTTGTTGSTTAPDPTTGGTSTGTTGGCQGFICTPDGGAGNMIECDVWTQDCPDGQKCMPYSGDGDNAWESTKCTMVDQNPAAVGDPCTVEGSGVSGIDNCEKGAMCWDVVDGVGLCVAQCVGTPDAPMCNVPMTSCLISNDGVLTLCLPFCDPLLQDCPGDDLCIPNPQNQEAFLCVLDASGDEGQEWDVCEYINACDKGFACMGPAISTHCDPMAIGCCAAFCDTSAPACTDANESCLPWYDMGAAPPGYENVGVCGVPG